jgi:Flp pilus assembly pilin Flp
MKMPTFFRNKKGQNTAEYAIMIALVIGAAMAMQTYIKRGLQGGIKFAVDKSTKSGGTKQYEPYYLESDYTSTQEAYTDTEKTETGGKVTREVGAGAGKVTERAGYQKIKDTSTAD